MAFKVQRMIFKALNFTFCIPKIWKTDMIFPLTVIFTLFSHFLSAMKASKLLSSLNPSFRISLFAPLPLINSNYLIITAFQAALFFIFYDFWLDNHAFSFPLLFKMTFPPFSFQSFFPPNETREEGGRDFDKSDKLTPAGMRKILIGRHYWGH